MGEQRYKRTTLKRFMENKPAMAGWAFVVFIGIIVLLTPVIAPYSYEEQNLEEQYQGPSLKHWMGTDSKGRDLMTRVMYGGRISLAVGLAGAAVSLIIGVTYGSIAGFKGRRTDNIMMRAVDILYGLPFIFFVILVMTVVGRSIYVLFIALGAVQWLTMARIVRGQTIMLKEREFVEAARALGASNTRIIVYHLLPNLMGPIIVYATLTIPSVMLEEAFLSFLGLGVQPPASSWGSLAADGMIHITPVKTDWWLVVFPGMTLAATLFALNLLGDGLRDALET
ncbi:MAG TPA: ABC transporter permease [Candidatus Avalokitesvara rifleensis]|uniref:ABC transporter permease n=1 Tax=Candidatus Avalokitesvara rifleensis TaxID=3367620 RepID=UPI0027124331|nr:ABC transporter permease [Candidatus Brocadiales bacterium]